MLDALLKRARRAANKYLALAPRRASGHGLYGQGLEDLYLRRIFGTRRDGFYVDVGAHDGCFLSNTYGLYRDGWRGLCVEPNPASYAALRRRRPRDVCLNVGVAAEEGRGVLKWAAGLTEGSSFLRSGEAVATETVSVRPLQRILEEHGVPREFEVLSVDVEGMELEVLRSLDWRVYRPRIVIVEYNSEGKIALGSLDLLQPLGYKPVLINRWNILLSRNPEVDIVAVHRGQDWYGLDRVRL